MKTSGPGHQVGGCLFLEKPCLAALLRQILAHNCLGCGQQTETTTKPPAKQTFAYPNLVGSPLPCSN
ncbi:hypothetical protein [uncultured Desulfobulbus sp.]|uniref:hypothetical protein n=1 Tax=uncultured Desulfobulbus sp. TaxID=239745 RepID=UPI0029C60B54|nr:hypothetical protein [uncultured Desulfobulbus sp.]